LISKLTKSTEGYVCGVLTSGDRLNELNHDPILDGWRFEDGLGQYADGSVEAITVVQVPRERALDAPLPADVARAAAESIAEAEALGEENEVEVHADAVHARSIGHAIVEEAERRQVDLIVLGSSPRWRRQSRFFSPTVDHVLKHAHCEVLVVAFPEGVFDQV